MIRKISQLSFIALLAIATANASASFYVSSPGFYEPAGWNVGDAGTTTQLWDDIAQNGSPWAPDTSGSNPSVSTMPSLTVSSPGSTPGDGRTYSFNGNYGFLAEVETPTSGSTSDGTHVIVQVASTDNGGMSVVPNTIQVLDGDGAVITDGGENLDLLRYDVYGDETVSSSFGPVSFHRTIFEFFLPDYTGDIQVEWTHSVHAGLDALRIDTATTEHAYDVTAVPEPTSLALVTAGGLALLRRRSA